jgi:acetyltransferase
MSTHQAVTVRPIGSGDADALQAFVADGLGAESRCLRFHGTVNGCGQRLLKQLSQTDGRRHVAFAAWVRDGERETLIGEARYVVEADGETAELAIAVADAWQGRGVADLLLRALVDAARRAGLRWLYGMVLEHNARMAAFMRRHGFVACVNAGAEGMLRLERSVAVAVRVAPRPALTQRLVLWTIERLFGIGVPATL